ncbi:hypothetical protein CAL65_19285 [Alkalilimnicola ehrlichii]|uniref:Methyl-accepting chemotaxis protein n=1 Tax=Alkalilimnicola ehrlichii TaxID=351052 RepID=A0A3E0WKJ3_9GAMM|nr:hypothetical protein CAL65_19285 [Alkalilimnicola ehrlichii]
MLRDLDEGYRVLTTADASLASIRHRLLELDQALDNQIAAMERLSGQVLTSAENMAGRATLERVRERRELRSQLALVGDDPARLPPEVIARLMEGRLDVPRISGEVQTVVVLLADLGRQLQLADSADLLVSIRYNEIVQEINRVRQALASIYNSNEATSQQADLARELDTVIENLAGIMVSREDSVYHLREQYLAEQKAQQNVLADVVLAMGQMRDALRAVETYSMAEADRAVREAQAVASAGRVTLIAVTLVVIAVLGVFGFRTMQRVIKPLAEMRDQMKAISDEASQAGDLSVRIHTGRNDEIGQTAEAFNSMMATFQETIRAIVQAAEELSGASSRLQDLSKSSRSVSDSQQNEAEQVAAAMNQMVATVQEVARNTQSAADLAVEGLTAVKDGKAVVTETARAIGSMADAVTQAEAVIARLKEQSDNVSEVLTVIQAVSEQTNLLALNAAIEAARAGDHGSGFAVVADEVRILAQRTGASAKEIEQLISRLQEGADESVSVMQSSRSQAESSVEHAKQTRAALDVINRTVTQISDMNTQVAGATEEQSAVADKINESVNNLSDIARQTAAANRQLLDAGNELTRLATRLRDMSGRFRV